MRVHIHMQPKYGQKTEIAFRAQRLPLQGKGDVLGDKQDWNFICIFCLSGR